jgi:type VI secretion system protein ImpB
MPPEASLQHKLDRVRRPRVQITYDVETGGSPIKKELPFVLGVMADLSGHVDKDRKDYEQLPQRDFVEINRDTFGRVMKAIAPRLVLSVPNQIQKDDTKLPVVLNFESLDDFEPENVVRKVEPLRQLLEAREKLADLKLKAVTNDKFDAVLQKVIQSKEVGEGKKRLEELMKEQKRLEALRKPPGEEPKDDGAGGAPAAPGDDEASSTGGRADS